MCANCPLIQSNNLSTIVLTVLLTVGKKEKCINAIE